MEQLRAFLGREHLCPQPTLSPLVYNLRYAKFRPVSPESPPCRSIPLTMEHSARPNVSAAMVDASKNSQMLRDQAERCRRLARATTDATVSQRLLELAAEFEKQANALEPSRCR